MNSHSKKLALVFILIILVAIAAIAAYWYFMMGPTQPDSDPGENSGPDRFQPFQRTPGARSPGGTVPATTTASTTEPSSQARIPALRLLSDTPVGGYGASTTASTTVVRWVDRGRGNIYEANGLSLEIVTLSNTVVPRINESTWNRNLTAFIGSILESGSDNVKNIYAELLTRRVLTFTGTSTATTSQELVGDFAPLELRGSALPGNIIAVAASPKRDRVFIFLDENGKGVGYTSSFNGASLRKAFEIPLRHVIAEWPEENTIIITTKGSADQPGFVYSFDTKTSSFKKIVGPLPGLSAKISHDGKHAIISAASNDQGILTSIYSIVSGTATDAVIRTLAGKCAWGNFYKEVVYCAVQTQPPAGTYPDDWHRGTISFTDKIWQVNAVTGEVKLVSNLLDQADRLIDGFDLQLDEKDNFLFFMNKTDLSLWSLDLISTE